MQKLYYLQAFFQNFYEIIQWLSLSRFSFLLLLLTSNVLICKFCHRRLLFRLYSLNLYWRIRFWLTKNGLKIQIQMLFWTLDSSSHSLTLSWYGSDFAITFRTLAKASKRGFLHNQNNEFAISPRDLRSIEFEQFVKISHPLIPCVELKLAILQRERKKKPSGREQIVSWFAYNLFPF